MSPEGDASSESLWLPTCCLQLLQRICKARPNHLLIAADFDELPDVELPGQGAPLVASTVRSISINCMTLCDSDRMSSIVNVYNHMCK